MELEKGLYRHYKGQLYEVHMTAQDARTEEWMVVYKALYGEQGMWVRPYYVFVEKVTYEGVLRQRFEKTEW